MLKFRSSRRPSGTLRARNGAHAVSMQALLDSWVDRYISFPLTMKTKVAVRTPKSPVFRESSLLGVLLPQYLKDLKYSSLKNYLPRQEAPGLGPGQTPSACEKSRLQLTSFFQIVQEPHLSRTHQGILSSRDPFPW